MSDKKNVFFEDGQQFFGSVIDGRLSIVPVDKGVIVGSPRDALHKSLLAIYTEYGEQALIEAIIELRKDWGGAMDMAIIQEGMKSNG